MLFYGQRGFILQPNVLVFICTLAFCLDALARLPTYDLCWNSRNMYLPSHPVHSYKIGNSNLLIARCSNYIIIYQVSILMIASPQQCGMVRSVRMIYMDVYKRAKERVSWITVVVAFLNGLTQCNLAQSQWSTAQDFRIVTSRNCFLWYMWAEMW